MNDFPEVREAMAVVANLRMKRGGGEDWNVAPVVSDTLRAMANLREGDMHRFHERQRQAEETRESSRRRPRRSVRRPSASERRRRKRSVKSGRQCGRRR